MYLNYAKIKNGQKKQPQLRLRTLAGKELSRVASEIRRRSTGDKNSTRIFFGATVSRENAVFGRGYL